MLGVDRKSEQARAVRLWAQLSDRHRERYHCRRRGHPGANLRRGRCRQDDDRRTEQRVGLKPRRLAADTAYGTGKFLGWLASAGIAPQIPVWDKSAREDGTFSRSDFT